MSTFNLIMLFAVPLETLRLYFVWREVSKLAVEKGESVEKWATIALAMWLVIVGGLSTLAWFFFRHMWLVIFFTSIVFSSILYRYLVKRPLLNLPDHTWEDKIGDIGQDETE